MALAGGAVVGPEAVGALQRGELLGRAEGAPPERAEPRRVVVPDLGRCPAPRPEGPDVAVEPGGPALGRVGHHDVAGRVGQARAEQGHDRLDAGEQDARLAEVGPGLGPRVMGERDGDPAQAGPPVGSDEGPDGRLAAREAVLVAQTLTDPPGRVALPAVDRLVGRKPALDERGHGVHHGRRSAAGRARPSG